MPTHTPMDDGIPFRVYTSQHKSASKPVVSLQFSVAAASQYDWLINSPLWVVKFTLLAGHVTPHTLEGGLPAIACALSIPGKASNTHRGLTLSASQGKLVRTVTTTALLPGLWWIPGVEEAPELDDRVSGDLRALVFTVPTTLYGHMNQVRDLVPDRARGRVYKRDYLPNPVQPRSDDAAIQAAVRLINAAIMQPNSVYTLDVTEQGDNPATLVVYRRYS